MLCRFYLQIINQLQIRNAPVDARRCNTPIQIEIDMKCTNNSIDPPSFVWNMSLGIHDSGRNVMMLERERYLLEVQEARGRIFMVFWCWQCASVLPRPKTKCSFAIFSRFGFVGARKREQVVSYIDFRFSWCGWLADGLRTGEKSQLEFDVHTYTQRVKEEIKTIWNLMKIIIISI